MNKERTGTCLRQVEHIRGHLWHRYSITVNQVVVATVKLSKWPIFIRPTVLHTQKEYGMLILVPIKKKKWHERRHERRFLKGNNHDWYFLRFSTDKLTWRFRTHVLIKLKIITLFYHGTKITKNIQIWKKKLWPLHFTLKFSFWFNGHSII